MPIDLLAANGAGKRAYRLASRDPSFFTPAPHVIEAPVSAGRAEQTRYVPNEGTPELPRVLAHDVATKHVVDADALSALP
jgi:aspartate aminotransferase